MQETERAEPWNPRSVYHAHREPQPGTRLIARYKKETYHAEVVAGEEGKVLYQARGWPGIQESFLGRHRHHRQGLQLKTTLVTYE